MPEYICDECGKPFSSYRWTKRFIHTFCSQECDRKWKKRERLKKGGKVPY